MDRIFRYILASIIIGFLFYRCILKEEINCGLRDTLDNRHELIDSLYNQLDSLHRVIDTLQWEKQIFDYNIENNTTHLLSAIMSVESNYNDSAYNSYEDAVGCLQIRKCMVDDVNRILSKQGLYPLFTYNDRWLRHKSVKMFDIYCKYYGLTTAEEIARCWNGGPRGMSKPLTATYWKKVQENLDS